MTTLANADRLPDDRRVVLGIREVAQILGLDTETVRAAVVRGELPASKLGSQWLIPRAAVDRLAAGVPPTGETNSADDAKDGEN